MGLVSYKNRLKVAPFAGAWIETWMEERKKPDEVVAPFAGAWIETHVPILNTL